LKLLAFCLVLAPIPAAAADLALTIAVAEPAGIVQLAVYGDAASYDADAGALRTLSVPVTASEQTIVIAGLPEGGVAIKLFQDLDTDAQLSTNLLGIPEEPYGFSNNARGTFGPPSFEEAVFALTTGETAQRIELR
jgi:uncharacterized protein (DUF2141 family)